MHSPVNKIWTALFCLLSFSTLSCKKFLATYSQNNSFIESAEDLDELLVGEAYVDLISFSPPYMLYVMDDDVAAVIPKNPSNYFQKDIGFQYWLPQPRIDSEGKLSSTDQFFNDMYSRIARINSILYNIPLLREKGESPAMLNRISGEASFLRAYCYFLLVNIYGKPYDPATAANDYGVPLKTDPAVNNQFTSRSTTKQVYDQIIADLLEADKALAGANSSSTIRVNQAAARLLLSRVYLYMENYERADYFASQVISSGNYKLTDLNTYVEGKDFLNRNSAEVIFTMGASRIAYFMGLNYDVQPAPAYKASDNLILGYTPEDLRLKVFFHRNSIGEMRVAKKRTASNPGVDDVSELFLIRLAEAYLNKAEALAALDRFEEARSTLQEFRKTRFKPGELPPVNEEGATLVNIIRNERRLELCLETHRWFDLRRYAVNSKYPFSKSIQHRSVVFSGNKYIDNGYYELGPYEQDAAAYTVPIANDEIEFNNGLLTNESRPERPLKQ